MKNNRPMLGAQFIVETLTVAFLTFGNLIALAVVIALLSVFGVGAVGLSVIAAIMTIIAVPTTLYLTLQVGNNIASESINMGYIFGCAVGSAAYGFVTPFVVPFIVIKGIRQGVEKASQREPSGNEAFYSIVEDATTKATADFAAAYFHKHE